MSNTLYADANPEKRLFIHLITRDIPLIAAFLDLVDNSINAAIEPIADKLKSAQDYVTVFSDDTVSPIADIDISISSSKVEVVDTAAGISAEVAQDHVFKFGRSAAETHENDRLSVYGIGLKRAIFKLGNKITMRSDHVDGGFELILDVAKWEKIPDMPWAFEITARDPVPAEKSGTKIVVTELYDEVKRRLNDGVFEGELRDAISQTYAFYLAKFVNIAVNNKPVAGVSIELGSNHATDQFSSGDVTCAITAGIGIPQATGFRDRSSGWFVFCNGRAIISADKSPLTGWATAGGLPIFQPKHRPFLGTVFFVSSDPEKLPWNTTKSAINVDSAVWQEARRHMISVGRAVVTFLDSRYSDEGTEVASAELKMAAGERLDVMAAAAPSNRSFTPPKVPKPSKMKIQYEVKVEDVKLIANYIKKPSMGGAEVGRHTFYHFLKNEVGE